MATEFLGLVCGGFFSLKQFAFCFFIAIRCSTGDNFCQLL